ncbi:hypothetical protein RTBOTA2_001021 [Rhodotorula toruloides]|nr:hypothetical protein RTBOTA2_001021 [Rhodotorula toruloides]
MLKHTHRTNHVFTRLATFPTFASSALPVNRHSPLGDEGMADVSPGGGHGAPLQPLPAWLSRTSFPTATVDLPYTIATLLPNGVPTLIITAQRVTQYGTDILQLPLTVDPGADVSGQNLGDLYTTAGGDATQTVVRELGGTRMFTLGRESGTQALAGGTAAEGQSAPAAGTAMSAAEPPAASGGAPPASAYPPSAAQSPSPISASQQPSPAPTASVASVAASLSAALASATGDSTPDPASVASLSSAYASATSALSAASPSSASSTFPTSAPPSSLPSTPPSVSSSTSSSPSPSSTSSPALNPTHHLTPSQLAAAIAAPLAFLLLLLLLFICCLCLRRRRRRRAVAEEEGLLDSPASQPSQAGGKKRVKSGGVLWEWVPTRSRSRLSGRSGSGRSVLSRLTGGLLGRGGAGGARSMAGSSPGNSPVEGEKGFSPKSGGGGEERSPRTEEEKGLLSGGEGEGGRDAGVAGGGAGLAAAGAAQQAHLYARQDDTRRSGPVEPFDDIDLTSPRLDLDSSTCPSRPLSPPTLLPIQPSSPIRLSRFYDPAGASARAYFPPSPSSYSTPSRFVPSEVPYSDAHYAPPVPLTYAEGLSVPLGPVRQATSTLSQLWQGYETNSPRTDAGDEGRKRESSRLGYLSWSTLDGGGGGQQQEYTPPHTPELPALRVIHEREDDERSYSGSSEGERRTQGRQAVVSEGGWLSGRLSGLFPSTRPSRDTLYEADEEDDGADEGDRLRVPLGVERRGSGDTGGSGQSDEFRGLTGGDLFLNSPRWIGTRRRRSSPPPFSSFEPLGSTSISYDPPIILHHQASSTSLDPPYRQPRHWSSFATETESRYHDADSPIFAPTPAESPGLYPSSSQLPRVTTVVKGRHQREDSGVSVLGRIAASFGALKGGVAAGLGIDGEGAGAGAGVTRRRGMPRRREFSTESSMDPFQYSYATANLPTVPSPTSSPRKQRTRRSLTALRHSQSQPMMQKPSSNAPPLPFPSARPLSTVVGRYHDPFADADVDGGADDERAVQQRAHQERREYEYGQEREGPDMGEIRRVGEQSE